MSKSPRTFHIIVLDLDPTADEAAFNRWYSEEHMPERLACPGFRSGARFKAVSGHPQYFAVYELDGPQALQTPQYRSLFGTTNPQGQGTDETKRMVGLMRNVMRNTYLEIE